MYSVTIALLFCVLALFYGFYRKRKNMMSVFKKMGVPGPEPNFLFGNLLDFRNAEMYKKQQEWRQKYGDTYGYFEGPTPVLVTSDVEVLHEVFVKQFNNFHARKLWPVQVDPDKDEDVHMFFARGRRWKRLRNVVNPAFSTSKIKKLFPLMNDCINRLLDILVDRASPCTDKTIEVLELFRRLTLDSILRCEIGIDQNSVKNPDDPFLRHCKGVIDDTTKLSWLYLLGYMFPTLHFVWIRIYKFLHNLKFNPVYWLEDRMREVIILRRNLKETHRVDLVQHMLNARYPTDKFLDIEQSTKKANPMDTREFTRKMTNEEIVQHAFLFLLAGYETTSTSLAYIFYELSKNPQVQERLRHEVKSVLPRGYSNITFDDLKKLTYLDYVIWEALRKYPLASVVIARQCMKPCRIGTLDIPFGMLVHANLWDVQYDKRHWGDNPEQFNPLRFMPEKRRERHPMAWMPFGSGPRACAGMKFAFVQLKMIVAKILRDFDFHPDKYLTGPIPLKQGATILPANGVHLAAVRRASALAGTGSDRRRGSRFETSSSSLDEDRQESDYSSDNEAVATAAAAAAVNDLLLDEGLDMLRRSSMTRAAQLLSPHSLEHLSNIYNGSRSRGNSLYEDSSTSSSDESIHKSDIAPRTWAQLRRDSLCRSIDRFLTTCRDINIEKEVLQCDDDKDDDDAVDDNTKVDPEKTEELWKFPPTMDDVLSDHSKPRKSHVYRRGSLQPELESIRETGELEFMMTKQELSSSMQKGGTMRKSQYHLKRRGSG